MAIPELVRVHLPVRLGQEVFHAAMARLVVSDAAYTPSQSYRQVLLHFFDAHPQSLERTLAESSLADHHDGELVATKPSDDVGGTEAFQQAFCEQLKRAVSDVMTKLVVELLEAVEIEEQQLDTEVITGAQGQNVMGDRHEATTIRDSC